MQGDHVVVSSYDDIEATDVPDRAAQRVATIFSEQDWDHAVWIPDWLLEDADKDIETVESDDHLAVGDVADYSEKAWQLRQPHRHEATGGAFLPKSQVVVFERVRGVETIETPQAGLASFTGGPR